MTVVERLASMLTDAARGCFPVADAITDVLPAPAAGMAACVAFTAHSVVAANLDPDEIRARLALHPDPLAAALAPDVVVWLAERTGLRAGIVDVLLAAIRTPVSAPTVDLLEVTDRAEHPRVARALERRTDVRVFVDAESYGVVTIGRGLVGRLEVNLELDEPVRAGGIGRELLRSAIEVVEIGDPLFAQVSPGNARSLRSFLAAGFVPIGAEVLFH